MGRQIDTVVKPIRSYYNESDRENSDYDQVLPITSFDAVLETGDPESMNLTTLKQNIEHRLSSLDTGKQNIIQAGNSGNIAIFTGQEGVLSELLKIDNITTEPLSASSNKIITEKAIVNYYQDVIQPEIGNAGGLGEKVESLEIDRTIMQGELDNIDTQLSTVTSDLLLKASISELDDVRVLAQGKADVTEINAIKADVNQTKIDIQDRIIKNIPILPGTYTKVIVDEKGLITSGSNITLNELPDFPISKITDLDNAISAKANVEDLNSLQTAVNGKLSGNNAIAPGTATKVTYDAKGLITNSDILTEIDLPAISIDKITGLRDALDAAGSESSIEDIRTQLNNKLDKNLSIVAGTATKITYDVNGLITSGSNITAADIPVIPISKVAGLDDNLISINNTSADLQIQLNNRVIKNEDIVAATATKVTYDAKGLITGSQSLIESDIPEIPTSKVTGLDAALANIGDIPADIETQLNNKLDKNIDVVAGTFTKITFDIKGLITSGSNLIEADIPELGIDKITNLQATINDKLSKNIDIIAGVGTKISYDTKGLVIGAENLTANDIPEIPTSKVTGLDEALANIDIPADLEATLNAKLDKNIDIVAGTYPKITYDTKGLITGGQILVEADIPTLPTSKIIGLDDALANIDIPADLQATLNAKLDKNIDIVAGTATKITYDVKGLIISGETLVASDIPELGIDKITNLQATIDGKLSKNIAITAGTATKITYDVNGLITASDILTAADIPEIPTSKIIGLDDALANIDIPADLQNQLDSKVTKNADIVGGTFAKITYDDKGLVTSGQVLTESDIPEIGIAKVTNLQTSLDGKATVVASTTAPVETLASNILYCVYE
jgi:hypothetical protein